MRPPPKWVCNVDAVNCSLQLGIKSVYQLMIMATLANDVMRSYEHSYDKDIFSVVRKNISKTDLAKTLGIPVTKVYSELKVLEKAGHIRTTEANSGERGKYDIALLFYQNYLANVLTQ